MAMQTPLCSLFSSFLTPSPRICYRGRPNRSQHRLSCLASGKQEEERFVETSPLGFTTTDGVVEEVSEPEIDYNGESTEGDLMVYPTSTSDGAIDILGLQSVDDILDTDLRDLEDATNGVMQELNLPPNYPAGRPERGIYCSRAMSLRSISCIGYDMDYTLIHYDVNAWEGRAYEYGLKNLAEMGYPTEGLQFDPDLVIRGLIVDKECGNLVKVDRFGKVRRAMHGTTMLSISDIRDVYGRETVNLRNERRWYFLNTFFSVSEAVMYMQLVDRLDEGKIPSTVGPCSYPDLYNSVSVALYRTHVEGALKAEIIQDPGRFVEVDPEMAETLLEQRDAGKRLLLITNSDYQYTNKMMSFAYDRFLPGDMKWRDMFDMVVVNARKPEFFIHNNSLFEIVTPEGLMQPALKATKGGLYCGGSARQVEKALDLEGVKGDDVLYVGDHIYTDAAMAKLNFRWRTALVMRELEDEIRAIAKGAAHHDRIVDLMAKKSLVGDVFNHLRLGTQPVDTSCSPDKDSFCRDDESRKRALAQLLMVMVKLDHEIAPMVEEEGRDLNERWGYLGRAGLNDKSALFRQIEKWADIYTSRVSNFHRYTPYMYFHSSNQSLAHDPSSFLYKGNHAHRNNGDSGDA